MIEFQVIRYKNFLSSGNNITEIELNRAPTTLIVGHNGAGKSTLLDALSFALFGRAHRNINKTQLVNSINQKDCMVEVELRINNADFRIKRTIKPNTFEIYKNDVLINQDSHAKQYQKILEQNILGLTHKSFHQIVVLGSSSFIPFMQLNSNHRREVIEDLLDINMFSKMNLLLREQNSRLRDQVRTNAHDIELADAQIKEKRKHIRHIASINQELIDQKQDQIDDAQGEVSELSQLNKGISQQIEEVRETARAKKDQIDKQLITVRRFLNKFTEDKKRLDNMISFYQDNDHCPTCEQEIDPTHKEQKLGLTQEKHSEAVRGKSDSENVLDKLQRKLAKVNAQLDQVWEWHNQMSSNNEAISRLNTTINTLQHEIEKIECHDSDSENAQDELDQLRELRGELVEAKLTLSEQQAYNAVISEMLKDSGIKTKIIKQYMPVINKVVNQYLGVLDFFVHFDLDENFVETIRSRHRDFFSYDSFSEGEKQRIDLALLFTWRMIAKMKNSVATNLLILDETFDSSLDHEGVDNLMKILYTLDDGTNVFVISHKGDLLEGKFDSRIEFAKDKNFSKIKG